MGSWEGRDDDDAFINKLFRQFFMISLAWSCHPRDAMTRSPRLIGVITC